MRIAKVRVQRARPESDQAKMKIPNELWHDDNGALDSLPRRELAFRLLVDAVQDYAIFLLSTEGRVLTWNRGAERIKGYSADEIIGQHFSVFYTPEERGAGRPMSLLGLAAERGRFEDEGWRVRKDGTSFWADVIVTALYDDDGVPYAYAKVTRDLTERRASEERRRKLLAEQRARAAAEEALAARERFLSIASHELKTPIASLRLAAESILHAKAAGRLDDERLQVGLDRILTASNRLGALVEELLDLTRLTADALPIHRAETDLVGIASEVIARFADAGVGERIRLIAPSSVVVEADASRIDQVLTNLVDNALKYSEAPSRGRGDDLGAARGRRDHGRRPGHGNRRAHRGQDVRGVRPRGCGGARSGPWPRPPHHPADRRLARRDDRCRISR